MKFKEGFRRVIGERTINVFPDSSVNKREFERQTDLQPDLWNTAFEFLEKTDLNSLKPGKYDIIGKTVYASVEEYVTKNEENSRYEAHRKYADIQYLISGSEKIGVVPLSRTKISVPYDDVNDISFLTSDQDNFFVATGDRFFVFFPEDAHRPGVKNGENAPVHKVVIKIRMGDQTERSESCI